MDRRLKSIALVLAIFLAFMGWQLIAAGRKRGLDLTRDHASTRTNQWGTKALRELCDTAGLRVHTWSRPWDELHDRVGLLIVLDPAAGIRRGEMPALLKWVNRGGRLILAVDPDPSHTIAGAYQDVPPYVQALAPLGLGLERPGETTPAPQLPVQPSSPLAQDARQISVPSAAAFKRLTSVAEAKGYWGVRYTRKLRDDPVAFLGTGWTEHVKAPAGPAIASFTHGKGEIYVVADVEMLDNSHIKLTDNVIAAANLIFTAARNRDIYFDEYHHGKITAQAEGSDFDTSPMSRTIWMIVLVFVIFAVGKFQRFGRAVPLPPPPRRATIEYADAYASLYRRAGKGHAALVIIADRFRRRLCSLTALSPIAPPEQVAEAVALRRRVNRADLAALLERLETVRHTEALSDDELLKLTRAVAAYEEVIFPHV